MDNKLIINNIAIKNELIQDSKQKRQHRPDSAQYIENDVETWEFHNKKRHAQNIVSDTKQQQTAEA